MYTTTTEGSSPSTLRTMLDSGNPVFGTFYSSTDPVGAERQSAAGWDFVILDLQHGAPTYESLVPLIIAVELGGSSALVRVPWNEPAAIMRALDCGAQGVVVPMVNTASDAAAAARACRYPPLGERSFGQLRGKTYGGIEGANATVMCFAMIETAQGVDNLVGILDTPGIDGVFVGPVDLKLGLGLPMTTPTTDPRNKAALDKIQATCHDKGRIAGGFIFSADDVATSVANGWRLIAVMPTSDIAALRALPLS